MALAQTDSFDERRAVFAQLATRNRIISALRIIVPAAGVAAFALLVLQIYVANLLRQYGVSGIRIDRGALVVDAPHYTASGTDGARYSLTAKTAQAPVGNPAMITMKQVTLDLDRPNAPTMHIQAASAAADTAHNIISVPGTTNLRDDKGLHGTVEKLQINLTTGVALSKGAVAVTFADGSTLDAADMRYDGSAQRWTFHHASVVLPDLPEAAP